MASGVSVSPKSVAAWVRRTLGIGGEVGAVRDILHRWTALPRPPSARREWQGKPVSATVRELDPRCPGDLARQFGRPNTPHSVVWRPACLATYCIGEF